MFKNFPKIAFFACLTLILVLLGAAGVFLAWWWQVSRPADAQATEKQIFVVPKGYGVDAIAQKLRKEGLIRNELAFKIMVTKEGISKDLQAGDFYLMPSMNLYEMAQTLTHGTVDIWVMVPEGLRREEIAKILVESFAKHSTDFDQKAFLEETENLEGFLFPETYLIPKHASASQIVEIFRKTFDEKVGNDRKRKAGSLGLTFVEIVNFASLVEREAKYDSDRALVAGILIKRYKNDWPLQVDASLQYFLGSRNCREKKGECNWWPRVVDTKFVSPYNTYLQIGLPPSPICNPSLSSIQAVLEARESQYWYYLSDNSGRIHYAESFEEHKENIKKYLD